MWKPVCVHGTKISLSEEANRQLIDVLADFFCANCPKQRKFISENRKAAIFVTGTAIDACVIRSRGGLSASELSAADQTMILLTMHRRENLGVPMQQVFRALAKIAEKPTIKVVFPMHKNPQVRGIAMEILGELENVTLIEPLDVIDFHNVANQSTLI